MSCYLPSVLQQVEQQQQQGQPSLEPGTPVFAQGVTNANRRTGYPVWKSVDTSSILLDFPECLELKQWWRTDGAQLYQSWWKVQLAEQAAKPAQQQQQQQQAQQPLTSRASGRPVLAELAQVPPGRQRQLQAVPSQSAPVPLPMEATQASQAAAAAAAGAGGGVGRKSFPGLHPAGMQRVAQQQQQQQEPLQKGSQQSRRQQPMPDEDSQATIKYLTVPGSQIP